MKEFKGTPGPWVVHEIGRHWNNRSLTHLDITFGEDGECICDTVYQRADANIIAAAPELLEVLQAIIDSGFYLSGDLHDMAEAAINKALGE